MLAAFTGFLAGVAAAVCAFRWLDRCWIWERQSKLFRGDEEDEDFL